MVNCLLIFWDILKVKLLEKWKSKCNYIDNCTQEIVFYFEISWPPIASKTIANNDRMHQSKLKMTI